MANFRVSPGGIEALKPSPPYEELPVGALAGNGEASFVEAKEILGLDPGGRHTRVSDVSAD